jgi:diaminopimelate decarboxylase
VGPICESADDFGTHDVPVDPAPDAVVIRDAGAYGFTMASCYNGRALPAEVFVAGGRVVEVFAAERGAWAKTRLGP